MGRQEVGIEHDLLLDQKLEFLFGLLLLTDGECGDQPSLLEPEADKVVIRQ